MDAATLKKVKILMGVDNDRRDEVISELLTSAIVAVAAYIGRPLTPTHIEERHNGNGKNRLVLRITPVIEVKSVHINGRLADDVDGDDWLLIREKGFPEGIRNIKIAYEAGFKQIPADIMQAIAEIVQHQMNVTDNGGVQSKSLAGETITFSNHVLTAGFPPSAKRILDQHKARL